jgi:Ca-activated chloride channel family protein
VDDTVEARFSFDLELKSAFPVEDIRMPGYTSEAQITKRLSESGEIYAVSLDFPEGGSLTRDIVLYYRLDDSVPARLELVPFRQNSMGEGTFMVVVTPGADLKRIQDGTDWTFVLDVSGSMGGNKIATLADGICRAIGKMVPQDRFRVVTFNDKSKEFSGGYINATPENVNNMIARIKAIQAGGGTALYEGLEMGYDGLEVDRITGIILVTDGVANVGPAKYSDLMNLHRRHDIRLFTFVIGNSANQPLLHNLAKESGGYAMNISTGDDIIGRIIQAKAKVLHESIYNAKLVFHGEGVHNLVPATIGSLYAGQQVVMFGRYNSSGKVKIEMSGRVAGQEKRWNCTAMLPETDTDNPEIERLWALATIEEHMAAIRDTGETEVLRQSVVDLGTEYSLVTDYTAMVVAAQSEMEEAGIERQNARRVEKERKAQARRASGTVKNYRADNHAGQTAGSGEGQQDSQQSMFGNRTAHNIGTGPVGPLFLALVTLLWRKKK